MWTEYLEWENGADGVKKNLVRCLLGNLKEPGCVADIDVDGEYIRIDMKARGWQGLDWIYLAEDRDTSGFLQRW
jgi:hypothetical protein